VDVGRVADRLAASDSLAGAGQRSVGADAGDERRHVSHPSRVAVVDAGGHHRAGERYPDEADRPPVRSTGTSQ
jgi:hypothetical protein